MPMETGHGLEHTTERLTEGLRCPWKWGHCFIHYENTVKTCLQPWLLFSVESFESDLAMALDLASSS